LAARRSSFGAYPKTQNSFREFLRVAALKPRKGQSMEQLILALVLLLQALTILISAFRKN